MPIVIDLDVSNKKTDKSLDKLQKALETLDAVQQRLNATLSQTAATANQAANAFGKMATNGRRAQSSSPTQGQRRVSAYYSAIAGSNPQAALNYANSRLAADPYDAQAIRLKNRAQGLLSRQSNPQHGLQTAMARTRWAQTASGMVGMPLGVDLAKYGSLLLGSGVAGGGAGMAGGLARLAPMLVGMLNPFTVAILAAVAATAMFMAAMRAAASSIGNIAKTAASAGNLSTVQRLAPFAASLGTDVGSLSGRLQSSINSGIGAGFAMQAGINPIGGPFGDNNYAGKLHQAMNFVANAPNYQEARRRAEGLGTPELANLNLMSPGNKAHLAKTGAIGVSERDLGAAQDFNYTMSSIADSFERIKNMFLAPALKGAAMILEYVANTISSIAAKIQKFFEDLFARLGIKAQRQDENIRALRDNTRALNGMREVFGGGARAQGAVPSKIRGLSGENMGQVRLGAI